MRYLMCLLAIAGLVACNGDSDITSATIDAPSVDGATKLTLSATAVAGTCERCGTGSGPGGPEGPSVLTQERGAIYDL